jgi:hypothetical protein
LRKTGGSIRAASLDESGVLAKDSSTLTLEGVTVSTTGASSSSDDSSFYGLDAGVLAFSGASIEETGGSVSTTGAGANGVFSYGSGSKITIAKTTITATGQYAHGIMASGGGAITADDLDVHTSGASSASIATDRGGGTITVVGGTYTTKGRNSPGIYSTGSIEVSDATIEAIGAEAAVIEGSNSVTVHDSELTGTVNRGVMIYQSFSGDAGGDDGVFSETGGSLRAASGPLFFVTNATGTINLKGVRLTAVSGVLLDAAASTWGTSGSNGGDATLNASGETLNGSVEVDGVSRAVVRLVDDSHLTGAINAADTAKSATLALDGSSWWTVTGTSHLTGLEDRAGISGSTVTNIDGDGHTVTYDKAANPSLDGRTYRLVGGGTLTPA